MWSTVIDILIPIVKFLFEIIAKKKLNDEEFIKYVRAQQKRKAKAGQAAISWEKALEKAQKELKEAKLTKIPK